jgi:hypothetical protein
MGLEIEIDPKELYDGLNDMLDEALDVTFFADLRTLLQKAVEAQVANLGTYPFAIRCKVEILGETKFFDPALDSKDKISCDKTQITKLLTAEGISLADITDLLNSRHGGQYSCTNPNAVSNGNKCYVNLGMVATALAKEPDRNDMDGTRRTQNFNFRVSLNDVMPQIMTAIKAARIPMKDDDLDVSRPADLKKLKTTVAANKDYFLGLVGVYRFLNDGELKKVKLSLNDLHEIFAGENFMRSRLTGYGPGTRHARILVDDQERGHFSPLLTYDQKASAFRLLPEFKSTDYTYKALDLSATTAASLFKKSTLPFSETFAMFKDIPDSRQLEDFVFNSSHHEEWNPMGQKYLSVAEFKNSKKPITCNMNNPGVNFSLEKGTTIDCNTDYSKVTCNDDGKCTFPKDYAYPFVLFERGWYGEGVGRLFALGSRSSGREIGRGNGRGILIKEYKSSNPAGACNSTAQKDTVVSFIDEFWCGPDKKCSENITAYCLDMDALGTPARTRFFPGGKYVVSGYDTENGRSWQWEVPQIGVYDSSLGHSKDFAACLHVNSNSFVNFTDATYKSSMVSTDLASAVDSNNDGFVDTHYLAFVNGQIKNCDDAADTGKEKLRLYQYENFADVGSMYVYLLNSDDRTLQYKNSPGAGLDWNDTYLKVSATEIETLLGGGKKITPSSAEAQINSMRFVNPKHDAKFDPYCDDLNNNGACDCYPIESLSADRKTATYSSKKRENPAECGLNDKAAEPTVAQLPYCVDCQGSDQIATFFKNFGGKKGAELKTTVNPTAQNDVQTYISSLPKGLPLDFRQVFSCAYVKTGETLPRQPSLVQWGQFEGNHPGCPGSNGVGTSGPIRLMQFKTMRNAFDTARPNTLIKLINFATKSVGQGRKIKADEKVFSPEEVVAMLVLRLNMKPQNLKILDSTGNKELANFMAQFEPTRDPEDDHMSPFSSIFKAIMYKAKKYSLQDVKLKQKDD